MKGYIYLSINKENSIIIFGESLSKNEIVFRGTPSFFDALRFSDSSPPQNIEFPLKLIPLSRIPNKTIHFHDPLLLKKIPIIMKYHSLVIIDKEKNLTPETAFNILQYFLIKKGNKIFFLTKIPDNKIIKRSRVQFLPGCKEQNCKQEQ